VTDITASSFNNNIRNKIKQVIEDQYGDTLTSSPIELDPVTNLYPLIDDTQWDNLRIDIIKARVHQIGIQPTLSQLPDVSESDVVSATILEKYVQLADRALLESSLVAIGQYEDVIPPTLVNPDINVSFSGEAFHRTTITWATPQEANQFFNAGGGFLLSLNLIPLLTGPQGAQTRDFVTLASVMGTKFFGFDNWKTSTSNYVDFTPPISSADAIYSGNRVRFRSAINSSNISLANQLILEVRLDSIYQGGAPSGSGAGAAGYGDQVSVLAGISILQRQSALSVVSPLPTNYLYPLNWSVTVAPITY